MKGKKLLTFFIVGFFLSLGLNLVFAQTPFWTQTKGPEGGNVSALAVDSDGRIFAGLQNDDVYRSQDDGLSWEKIGPPVFWSAWCIAIAINSSDEIFLFIDGRIYKSIDHGESWSQWGDFSHHYVYDITIHPTDENIIFIGTQGNGIFRTSDGGLTWDNVLTPADLGGTNLEIRKIAVDPFSPNASTVYAGAAGWDIKGLYRSDDHGITWASAGFVGDPVGSIAIQPTTSYIHLSVGCGSSPDTGEWRSIDHGMTWQHIGTRFCAVNDWAFDSSGNIYAAVFQNWGVHFSSDNGVSWGFTGLMSRTVKTLAIKSSGEIFAGTNGDGVYKTPLSEMSWNWNRVSSGIVSADAQSVAVNADGNVFAGTGTISVHRSIDKGENWIQLNPDLISDTIGITDLAISSSNYIFACWGHNISISSDNGETWVNDLSPEVRGLCCAIYSSFPEQVFAGTWDGVYSTADNGGSWSLSGLAGLWIDTIAAEFEAGIICAGARTSGLWLTLDEGANWTRVGEDFFGSNQIRSLAISPEGFIYAGVSGLGLCRSMDNGTNWDVIAPHGATCIAINVEGHIYIGTWNAGIYRLLEDGYPWEEINSGLTNLSIRDVVFGPDGYLYAATWGSGIFRSVETTLSDPVILINELIEIVENMNLKQGINNSLDAKLENARKSLESVKKGNRQDAANKLQAFINECEAQRGKALTNEQADLLVSKALVIIELLQGS